MRRAGAAPADATAHEQPPAIESGADDPSKLNTGTNSEAPSHPEWARRASAAVPRYGMDTFAV